MRQSPRNFFLHLKNNLEKAGFVQSKSEPCLFSCREVVCLCYVDDCLFYAPTQKHIDTVFEEMQKVDLDFHIENEMAGFLGVDIVHHEDGSIELLQTGLIDRIIIALGLEGAKPKKTPAEFGALGSDKDGPACNETFSYPSIIGMMMYLTGNSRPELAFSVHQCARFTHNPRASHEEAVQRIGKYLIGTRLKGLILRPDPKLGVEMFVDADFAGLWGFEDPTTPSSCRSRTGFVICLGGCPVLWKSTMQTEIASSTMHAEYIALSTAMRDLLPFRTQLKEQLEIVGLQSHKVAVIKTIIYEDNQGCQILATSEPGRTTANSKAFAVKWHWFREQLVPGEIVVVQIKTDKQLADIFTKGLRKILFETNRNDLCGWVARKHLECLQWRQEFF